MLTKGLPAAQGLDVMVESSLSPVHRDDRSSGWVLSAMGVDIARASHKARRIFARKLDEMIDVVAQLFSEKSPKEARQIATGALATMMGSIVLARAVGDKKLSEDLLGAGRQALGGQSAGRRAGVPSGVRRPT